MTDPLLPHLLDLLKHAPPDSFVLGGGFGLIDGIRAVSYTHLTLPTIYSV